jgi:putative DNA primase/helicase
VEVKKGYDIYDVVQDNLDPLKIIKECKELKNEKTEKNTKKTNKVDNNRHRHLESNQVKTKNDQNSQKNEVDRIEKPEKNTEIYRPFICIGHDEGKHYFLTKRSNMIKKFSFGSFNQNKLLELAPLAYWIQQYPAKTGFKIDSAIDEIISESENKGYYQPDKIRGAGVWKDNSDIIINNGNYIEDQNGNRLENYNTNYYYVTSEKKMGSFSGEMATAEQGKTLIDLFRAQHFESELATVCALGWTLIAPFCGILKWRPHIWITGPSGAGKSWGMENIIAPLCGPFAYIGTGKDTDAGLYRDLWKDPQPVIKDEMEPGKNKKTKERIEAILETARNASSNFSSYKTIANTSGGVDRFCIRSTFCFSSVLPYFFGDAIASRIIVCRLKFFQKKIKAKETIEIMKTGIMKKPEIFRKRTFKYLNIVLKNIDVLRNVISDIRGNQRQADNYAPLLAAYINLTYTDILTEEKAYNLIGDLIKIDDEHIETFDEDKLFDEIFCYKIKTYQEEISIGELIYDYEGASIERKNVLHRYGIRLYRKNDDGITYLAICQNYPAIQTILASTIYAGKYSEVLKRHELAEKCTVTIRFAAQIHRAILFNWELIKAKYFEEEEQSDLDYLENIL